MFISIIHAVHTVSTVEAESLVTLQALEIVISSIARRAILYKAAAKIIG